MIQFDKALGFLAVDNEIIRWHLQHGWVWNAWNQGEYIGVMYATLLCGDGCILHFDTCRKLPWHIFLAGLRKGIRMIAASNLNVVYATVPEEKDKLIRILIALGFGLTDGGFVRDGKKIALLKYFSTPKRYIKQQPTT